jgi:DNA-binding NtrC family response regulator
LEAATRLAPAAKVIVMTGGSRVFAEEAMRQNEFRYFLQKPFSPAELLNVVRRPSTHLRERA